MNNEKVEIGKWGDGNVEIGKLENWKIGTGRNWVMEMWKLGNMKIGKLAEVEN